MRGDGLKTRAVVRIGLVILALVGALYIAYLLRRPLGWLVVAAFVALAVAGPVEFLARRMPRAPAIAAVYGALITVPVLAAVLLVPTIAREATAFAADAPGYVSDAQEAVADNGIFQRLNRRFDVETRLLELAEQAPSRIGDFAGALTSIGFGVVDSLFAVVTILILSVFMVGSGPRWKRAALGLVAEGHRERAERALTRIASAVSGYVRAQLTIAVIAAVTGYVVMALLGVPFREPLALLIGFASLIPVIGSLLWGITVGLVTLVVDFPTTTILWVIWAVVYPQFENYVLQPQLQKRAVQVEPFVIIVAVLFGGTLLGIVGALLAIPAAAAIQVVAGEWWAWRRDDGAPMASVTASRGPGSLRRSG